MIDKKTDFFKYVDNFAKIAHVVSVPIKKTELESPFITIAIPTYKRSDLLKEAIDSALNLECEWYYEILVVDNNPQRGDETETLMHLYSEEACISYYKNAENVGMVNNWNRLYELAKGKWVVMLHDDDMLRPDFLKKMLPFFKDEIGMCVCKHQILQDGKLSKSKEYRNSYEQVALIDFAWGDCIAEPVGVCMQKDKVIHLGGFNADFYPTSDYCFFALFAKNFKILILNEQLAIYRIECNASFRKEVLDGFMNNDYYLSCAVLNVCNVSSFIKKAIQECRIKRQLKNLRKRWNSQYDYPELKYTKSNLVYYFSYFIYKVVYKNYVRIGKMMGWRYYKN